MCPECGKELLKRKSRFGTYFLGCSGFPKCSYMENLDGERIYSRKEKLKMKAAEEGKEETEKKTSKKKTASKKTAAKKTTKKTATAKKTATRKRTVKKESEE